MIVVSDSSPILNLARIGRLALLGQLYKLVLIPPVVFNELTASVRDLLPSIEATSNSWLTVAVPTNSNHVRELRESLDPDEAEAIVLAIERKADLLLVDERRGRRIAAALGLQITGLLGVLADAKEAGLIDQVKPVLDDLVEKARFWISADLYREVLASLGEP